MVHKNNTSLEYRVHQQMEKNSLLNYEKGFVKNYSVYYKSTVYWTMANTQSLTGTILTKEVCFSNSLFSHLAMK